MNKADHPALRQFLGAYLHQDWRAGYADTSDAVSDFMVGEPTFAPMLAAEIDMLLGPVRGSDGAETVIVDLGSFFVPSARGPGCREWLLSLRDQAARGLRAG